MQDSRNGTTQGQIFRDILTLPIIDEPNHCDSINTPYQIKSCLISVVLIMNYEQYHKPQDDDLRSIIDTNGNRLYEVEYGGLIDEIIRLNDVETLNCYINQRSRKSVLFEGETPMYDPFWIAAAHGSTDALRILLDLYEAERTQTEPLENRRFSILSTACQNGQLETVKFLLDRDPPLGAAYAADCNGRMALVCAGNALAGHMDLPSSRRKQSHYNYENVHEFSDYITKCEDMINLLIDGGASVRNEIPPNDGGEIQQDQSRTQQYIKTALGQAASRASYDLVTRLITEGADIHERQCFDHYSGHRNVTAMHIASGYCNGAGIQALLDNCGVSEKGDTNSVWEMVSVRDSNGRLPIHWAAMSHQDKYPEQEEERSSRTINAFKLLLKSNPDSINALDHQSATVLHHIANSHRTCGSQLHLENIVRFLCENGADASLYDDNRQTVFHRLAFHLNAIKPVILEVLLEHGGKSSINQVDRYGDTALHLIAKNLRQVELVHTLLSHGADVRAVNRKGETPLHMAARGVLTSAVEIDELGPRSVIPTYMHQLNAQDEIMAVLQEAAGISAMDFTSAEGKTPRQVQEERRIEWRTSEERKRHPTRGRGRGRG